MTDEMDSFDDLLKSNLEDNPFASHTGRSNSPDPWASYQRPSIQDDSNPFQDSQSAFQSYYQPVQDEHQAATDIGTQPEPEQELPETLTVETSDPLDTAAVNAEVEEPPTPSRPKPTFRQYDAPAEVSPAPTQPVEAERVPEAKTVSVPEVEPEVEKTPDSPEVASPPRAATPPSQPQVEEPSVETPKAQPRQLQSIASPLDSRDNYNGASGVGFSGESASGWYPQQEDTWVNNSSQSSSQPAADRVVPQISEEEEEDDDDDQPILRRPLSPTVPPAKREKPLTPVFSISVDDPQKVGDPIRGYTMYTVHTRTTSPLYQKSTFSVLRRFSDFLWLTETLTLSHPGVVVPSAPSKSAIGRFDNAFVSQRRQALTVCINKIANHDVLGKDPDLRLFLESDGFVLELKQRKAEIAAKNSSGLMASIGIGPRFYETDDWFEKQKGYLDSLESQMKGLVKSIEIVAKQRSEQSILTGAFATAVQDLSTSDQLSKLLSISLASLAATEHKAQDIQNRQAAADVSSLYSTAEEYTRLIGSVRLAFTGRARTWAIWQQSESDLRKAQDNKERAKATGESVTQNRALVALEEAHKRVAATKHDYDQCAKLIKSELSRFEQERIEDFKDALHEFLEGMISRQKEVISHWETHQQGLLKRAGGATPRMPGPAVSSSQPEPVLSQTEDSSDFGANPSGF